MTDIPMPDWVLREAAKRGSWHWPDYNIEELQAEYKEGGDSDLFRALCDMILKHEQPPVDRKLLCAREANRLWENSDEDFTVDDACVRAIELWEEGFGK